MTTRIFFEAMKRAEGWPVEAQEELANIANEIDARLRGVAYTATKAELEGIDRGLAAAREGRFASDAQVQEALSRSRA